MQNQIIQISVVASRPDQSHATADAGAAGVYEVAIPFAETAGLNLADVALESFHNSIAISSPEDFDIQVFDQTTGAQLTPEYGTVEKLFGCKRTNVAALRS
jgi:hypothetical protein